MYKIQWRREFFHIKFPALSFFDSSCLTIFLRTDAFDPLKCPTERLDAVVTDEFGNLAYCVFIFLKQLTGLIDADVFYIIGEIYVALFLKNRRNITFGDTEFGTDAA